MVGIVIVLLAVVLGGGYWLSTQQTPATTDSGESTSVVLKVVNDTKLGDYLVAANGMTLYRFTKDAANKSNCYDQCAANWPPYTVSGNEELKAGDGITGAITTIARKDGTKQLTYKGAPLYFWVKDTKPGEISGQNVNGVWFVVKP